MKIPSTKLIPNPKLRKMAKKYLAKREHQMEIGKWKRDSEELAKIKKRREYYQRPEVKERLVKANKKRRLERIKYTKTKSKHSFASTGIGGLISLVFTSILFFNLTNNMPKYIGNKKRKKNK
jgi:hypothetical protein